MKIALYTAALLALALASLPAAAQAPAADGKPGLILPIDPQLLNDLPEIDGVVPWRVLGNVKSTQVGTRVVPEFAPEVAKLDKRQVKVQGYMMPIVAGERHNHFLLTMRPPHCPFCMSLGPEYIVEVKTRSPVKHTYEPVVIAGRLSVLRDDPFGLYYRLSEAQVAAAR
jgi:uncharacterized protein